jgi:flagellar hook protein FlgE
MGLASAMNTALTGLAAAETTIDVVGNNLANANTVGFKASDANFATQFLQTQSLGSSPSSSGGGTNPRQIGLGTMVADISPDFNQGTIEISSSPTDLAIQGDGFFLVEGAAGEQLYTRNGIFKINSENNLTTISGNRLLGYGIDDQYQVQQTTLGPLEIPLGAAAVAQPTANVYLEGTLSPTGDAADTAEIIRTGILGDATYSAPGAGASVGLSNPPNVNGPPPTGAAGAATGGALTAGATYQYRVVFGDGTVGSITDSEGIASADIPPVTLGPGEDSVQFTNLPVDGTGSYSTRRLYRSNDGGTTYRFVAEIPDNVTTGYTDGLSDLAAAGNQQLDTSTITGNYSYYVTFADAAGGPGTGTESRPSPVIGAINVVDGRVQLRDLPVDDSGQWAVRRIYRNLAGDDNAFHFVGEINDASTAGLTFTDKSSDATIAAKAQIDLDGPRIDSGTLLTNVVRRDGDQYVRPFEEGTLTLSARKGGRSLAAKEFEIGATTTVLQLLDFMEEAMGIRTGGGPDPTNPIPDDASGAEPGGSVTADGQMRLVANNGADNAVEIGLSSMQLTTAGGTDNVDLPFSSIQTAKGESATTDLIVYDSLGIPLAVRLSAVLESRTSTSTTYRWYADSADNDPVSGSEIAVGTGLITFDGEGNFVDSTEATVSIDRRNVSSASPLEFELDFSQISGLAVAQSSLAASRQDGSEPGVLSSFIVGEDGRIRGVFSNGVTRDLGQIVLARFGNPGGLEQKGENVFSSGVNSGLPVVGTPGEQGIGNIIAGATELSNADIGTNLIDLILASTMYRGNTRVITTAQQMFDELLALRR